MVAIKHRILFTLHKHDRQRGPSLQCRVKWDGSRRIVTLNTGYRIDPERWDAEAQRCRPGSFHGPRRVPASTINAEIDRYTEAAEDAFTAFAGDGIFPETSAMRDALRERLVLRGRDAEENVLAAFDRFCAEQGVRNSWSETTHKTMRVVRGHLDAWHPDLKWKDFDEAGLSSYITYLREVRGLRNITIKKQIGYVRWFLGWADGKGLLPDRSWRTFKPKLKGGGKPVIYLTWDELMSVWDWDPAGRDYMGAVRDIFCFCAFTSLRYSDAVNLRRPDVGRDSITLTTVKTADPIEIQLNSWSREILGRYGKESFPGDRVFPHVPNQVMNRYLHEICLECGIDAPVHLTWYQGSERHDEVKPKHELVTSHAARRTFIVNALAMGISPTVVMQWTGHSDYDAMKPYIAVADSTKAAAMALFDLKKRDTKAAPRCPF